MPERPQILKELRRRCRQLINTHGVWEYGERGKKLVKLYTVGEVEIQLYDLSDDLIIDYNGEVRIIEEDHDEQMDTVTTDVEAIKKALDILKRHMLLEDLSNA